LAILAPLSDAPAIDPAQAYSHAESSFVHGYLDESQRESESGSSRYLYSAPAWAKRFQLLKASVMAWRGLSEDSLAVLSDPRIDWENDGEVVEKKSIEAAALIHLHRLDEAGDALVRAHQLCAIQVFPQCGLAMRSEGLLLLERGDWSKAKIVFLQCVDFARRSNDRLLEATALLSLGKVAAQQERHDEAIEFLRMADAKAAEIDANSVRQTALGDEGWQEFSVGNYEKALSVFEKAVLRAKAVGDSEGEILWTTTSALAYAATGRTDLAETFDLRAIALARRINRKQSIIDASEDLARLYIKQAKAEQADRYASAALNLSQQTGNRLDFTECRLLQGEAAAVRHDWHRSAELLQMVVTSPDSSVSRRWQAGHDLGRMYEAQGDMPSAQRSYESALGLVEAARARLSQEVSRLTFLENASSIYDDYIHLLVSEGKTQEALEAADWSRARTLQQGLGYLPGTDLEKEAGGFVAAPRLKAVEIARKANASLLFYWLGEKQSYLWVVSPERTQWFALPPRSELLPAMERYKLAILSLKDPLKAGAGEAATDASSLYEKLIAPAAAQLRPDRPVVLFVDGELGQLNFESLVVPSPSPHFWIEDATVLSAPSIRMFAESLRVRPAASKVEPKMLLVGDAIPTGTEFRALPMAGLEMEKVKNYFPGTAKIFQGSRATPAAYLASSPEKFQYIHFVTHGTASRTDPLESAVILSQSGSGEDTYKLYARDILRHSIDAQLVTISACNSSGSKSFAGEGMVGLSWAFLRAGAHNAIGSLWEVSDASTPQLMSSLYEGLKEGQAPAAALRSAKLSLIHSGGHFSRPFYWAPFQLYAGR
jgi:CHAT domain-containing protein/lipopolysaccharide biosynthesis regulator YciM